MTMSTVTIVVNSIAALIILANGLFVVINKMSRHTRHGMRYAWIAICTGAVGVLLGPLFGYSAPSPYAAILHVGFALLVMFDRRRPGDIRGIGS